MPTYLSPGVYVEEVEAGAHPIEGVGTAVAAFVGFAAKGEYNTATLVSNWAQYTEKFGDFAEGCYLPLAVYGYFLNGGTNCYVVRVGGSKSAAALPAGPQAQLGAYRVSARELGAGSLSVEVGDPAGENAPEDRFSLLVKDNGKVVETHQVSAKRGKENVVTVVNTASKLITIEEVAGASVARPDKASVALREAPAPPPVPRKVVADDYVGDVADRTGFGGLEAIDEVTMVSVPDLMSSYQRGLITLEAVKTVQSAVIAHCELMGDRMAILDPPPDLSPDEVKNWKQVEAGYDSKYATLYYPWIKVYDPSTSDNIFVPPSGHMAGVWARTDATRGVHKAPANEVTRGALRFQRNVSFGEQELLNPLGVNCLRSFPGRGHRVWGGRTASSDQEWKYVNVRRYFNYIEASVDRGTQWAVFEPNGEALWAAIRQSLEEFLYNEWYNGALLGATPKQAYFVHCDRSTMTQADLDNGRLICEVGIAVLKPAEFVIFRIGQKTADERN